MNDIDTIGNIVNNYMQAYNAVLEEKIDHLLYFLDSADYHLAYLKLRLQKSPGYRQLNTYRENRNYGWNSFMQTTGVLDILQFSLREIQDINIMLSFTNLNDRTKEALPSSLWRSNERRRKCVVRFDQEQINYNYILMGIDEVLSSWESRYIPREWPYNLQNQIRWRKNQIPFVKKCVMEYRDTISRVLDDISHIKSATADTLTSGSNFDFDSFKESFQEDLTAISASASWLYGQISKYIMHDISKLDLANRLLKSKTKDDLVRYMETIFFKTDIDAISKLRTEARELKTTTQNGFIAGLGGINNLLPYFQSDEIEYKLRNLSLWRQPIVDLRSSGVLTYAYNFDETWRTWPLSVSLQNLITPRGSQYIVNILDRYMAGINDALYELQQVLLTSKDEAVVALDLLWRELQSYKQQSQINDDFVR